MFLPLLSASLPAFIGISRDYLWKGMITRSRISESSWLEFRQLITNNWSVCHLHHLSRIEWYCDTTDRLKKTRWGRRSQKVTEIEWNRHQAKMLWYWNAFKRAICRKSSLKHGDLLIIKWWQPMNWLCLVLLALNRRDRKIGNKTKTDIT